MMALIFKFPVDRPPFFGIKFDSTFDAEMTNKFAPRQRDGWKADIKVEGVRIHIIISRNVGTDRTPFTYTIYEWNKQDLIKFLQACKTQQYVTFGHLAKVGDDLKIAHWPQLGYAWWIRINKIEYSN